MTTGMETCESDAAPADTVAHFTTLSPVLRNKRGSLSRRLLLLRFLPGGGRPLTRLSVIHCASWTTFDQLVGPDGRKRRLESRYLLFETNYDGTQTEYVQAFSDVIPLRVQALFSTCFGFTDAVIRAPGVEGRVVPPGRFDQFIDRNKICVLDYWAAIPDATVTAVRQALEWSDLNGRHGDRGARAFGVILGEPLRPTWPQKVSAEWVGPLARAIRGRYGVNPLLVATPVERGKEEALAKLCAGGVLRDVPGTHFARFALIPRELKDLGQNRPDRCENAYLLYSANHHRGAQYHLRRLRETMGDLADDVWGHCVNYPGQADSKAFVEYLDYHRLKVRYFFAGYPPRSVHDIHEALGSAERARQDALTGHLAGRQASRITGAR